MEFLGVVRETFNRRKEEGRKVYSRKGQKKVVLAAFLITKIISDGIEMG